MHEIICISAYLSLPVVRCSVQLVPVDSQTNRVGVSPRELQRVAPQGFLRLLININVRVVQREGGLALFFIIFVWWVWVRLKCAISMVPDSDIGSPPSCAKSFRVCVHITRTTAGT